MTQPESDAAFHAEVAGDRQRVETRLAELLDVYAAAHPGLREAMAYSLLGGGKRLRPLLCLGAHDAAGGRESAAALDVACAIECMHTYSLIHDDLPCMDDDNLRRGRPSSHRQFDEATAILVGDALLTMTFAVIAALHTEHGVSAERALRISALIADAGGVGGLIGGQALDLAGAAATIDEVREIHDRKTARLMGAALESGAAVAGADRRVCETFAEAGRLAGAAFQIVDDLLDDSAHEETLGKTPGKDVRSGKRTYPALAGAAQAKAVSGQLLEDALRRLPHGSTRLNRLIEFIGHRNA